MKKMDIHSHTYYSFCGKDDPHLTIDAAIAGGLEIFGISDHNYGIGERKEAYFEEITGLKKEYEGRITLLCGIEISVLPQFYDIKERELERFDYCLVELNAEGNLAEDNLVDYAKGWNIPTGIAHTDLFAFCEKKGFNTEEFFKQLAKNNIFWEMNVNYDSIHQYREHAYVKRFMEDELQQELIKKTGLAISVGFDGHRVEDYLPERVLNACQRLTEIGVRSAEEIIFKN